MLISICGKSCCGKSSLAKEILKYVDGIHVDIDKIAHDILKLDSVKNDLVDSYGKDIIENGEINRKKLGKIVFNDEKEMDKLSDITWKYMEEEIDLIIKNNPDSIIILDYLLLPKTKYFKMSEIRILLDIDYEIRKNRAIKRDKITEEDFLLREKASYQYNPDDFNYVLHNNDLDSVKKMVNEL